MRRRFAQRLRRSGPLAPVEESFRILRSNIEIALADLEPAIALVTSANAGEGKTWVAVGLARSLASTGRRVVLVDLDFRRPGVHGVVGAHNERGVSDVLLDRHKVDDCLQFVELDGRPGANRGLYVLPTGPPVSEPTELLGTRRTAQILDALAQQADIVLVDTPPVLPVADTLVIGRMAAGAVLVVEAHKTSVHAVQRTMEMLTRNQTRLLGVVVNKSAGDEAEYGYGGYGDYNSVGDEPRPSDTPTAKASASARIRGGLKA
jgi:capsular exopolysaccharide synthesis family protein